MKERESEDRIKKSFYFNIGFCKLWSEYPFYHPENLCAQFEDKRNVLKQSVEIDTNKPVGNGKEADATEVKAVNSEGF